MIWQLAFRPFFLFGSAAAAVLMGIWLGFLLGFFPHLGFLSPIFWHAHEMIFGYAVAIVAGFVLTAIRNWTGLPGLNGKRLLLLFLVWLAGRVVLLAFSQANLFAMLVDLIFYPLLAYFLLPYFIKDRELVMERVFFLFIALFMLGDCAVHLDALRITTNLSRTGLLLGLNTTVVIIVFMGGRVIPFFTEGTLAKNQPRTFKAIEILSAASAWAFLIANTWRPESKLSGFVALASAVIHFIRLAGWQVRRIRRVPMLWVLHLSYLWIVIGYVLAFASSFAWIRGATAEHAFTVGAIGMITFGMMSRVSLGHTGRRIHPHWVTVAGYIALMMAALVRVFASWWTGDSFGWTARASGTLWIIAFCLFLWIYTPILTKPRVDGRPG